MRNYDEAGFGLVRKIEYDIIEEELPLRSRSRAITIMGAIRAMHHEKSSAAIGVEDFRRYGYGPEGASAGLNDLVEIGLVELLYKGGRTGRGHKSRYRIIHQRDGIKTAAKDSEYHGSTRGKKSPGVPTPSTKKDRGPRTFNSEKAGTAASIGRDSPPFNEEKVGAAGTTKEVPVPVEQEQGTGTSSCASATDKHVAEAEHEEGVQAQRERSARIDKAAKSIGMTSYAMMQQAGGPPKADLLASEFHDGRLSQNQLLQALRNSEAGLANEGERSDSEKTSTPERADLPLRRLMPGLGEKANAPKGAIAASGSPSSADPLPLAAERDERSQGASVLALSPFKKSSSPIDFAVYGSPGNEIMRQRFATHPTDV